MSGVAEYTVSTPMPGTDDVPATRIAASSATTDVLVTVRCCHAFPPVGSVADAYGRLSQSSSSAKPTAARSRGLPVVVGCRLRVLRSGGDREGEQRVLDHEVVARRFGQGARQAAIAPDLHAGEPLERDAGSRLAVGTDLDGLASSRVADAHRDQRVCARRREGLEGAVGTRQPGVGDLVLPVAQLDGDVGQRVAAGRLDASRDAVAEAGDADRARAPVGHGERGQRVDRRRRAARGGDDPQVAAPVLRRHLAHDVAAVVAVVELDVRVRRQALPHAASQPIPEEIDVPTNSEAIVLEAGSAKSALRSLTQCECQSPAEDHRVARPVARR